MSTGVHMPRSIRDLPDVEEVAPDYSRTGYPEGFTELFVDPNIRLLRAGPELIVAFRNTDLRAIAANPCAGNMSCEALMRRSFIEQAVESQVETDSRPWSRRFLEELIFTANPPRHGPVRRTLARQIMPKAIERFATVVDPMVEGLVDELADSGELDLFTGFALRLTGSFWGRVFGLTDDERERTVAAVEALTPLFFVTRTAEEITGNERGMAAYLSVFSAAIERATRDGDSPMLQSMKDDFDALEVTPKPGDWGVWVAANVIDGLHTAALACVNVVYSLLRTPQAVSAVRADHTLLPSALTEGLRMLSPVIVTNRLALADFEYEGLRIPAGTGIALIWAAGNRDPAAFAQPNSYDLRRKAAAAMTFGGGVHICPGRYAGSMLALAALRALVNQRVEITLCNDEQPRWLARSFMRQAERIAATIRRVNKR